MRFSNSLTYDDPSRDDDGAVQQGGGVQAVQYSVGQASQYRIFWVWGAPFINKQIISIINLWKLSEYHDTRLVENLLSFNSIQFNSSLDLFLHALSLYAQQLRRGMQR